MKINVTLYNSDTNDVAIIIDLLRASTTITLALNTFEEVIPVNSEEQAFELRQNVQAILAGEKNAEKIENFDLSNSPHSINDFTSKTLVLKTTNGTKVINNVQENDKNTKRLIGTAINASAVAHKALDLADNEINLIMAGRKQKFTIEDCVGAGIIIKEIIKIAEKEDISLELTESAQVAYMISNDEEISKNLIDSSESATRLKELGAFEDIEISKSINTTKNVPSFIDGKIILI